MKILKVHLIAIILYTAFLYCYTVIGYREDIPAYIVILQIVFAFFFFAFLYCTYTLRLNIQVILLLVFLSSLVFAFILRLCYLKFTGTPFGEGYDTYVYHALALRTMGKDFAYFIKYLSTRDTNIDDYGYPFILYTLYSIAGSEEAGLNFTILINALVITLSTFYLYKLLLLVNIRVANSCFWSACCGFFAYFHVRAAVQVKENFFLLFIIFSFYYMYEFKKRRKTSSLILCFLCTACCYFFRMAIPVMIIISFLILLMSNSKNRKKILLVLLAIMIIGSMSLNIIFSYIFPFSLAHIIEVAVVRALAKSNNLFFAFSVGIAAALVGPFPNFNRAGILAILYNSGILFKMLISFPLLAGIWYIVKSYNHRYYAMVAYIGMGLIMVVLSGVSLDMRYQLTFYQIMLVVIAYAFQEWKIKKLTYYFYALFSVGLIIVYNFR
jgi:hypothetical protein